MPTPSPIVVEVTCDTRPPSRQLSLSHCGVISSGLAGYTFMATSVVE